MAWVVVSAVGGVLLARRGYGAPSVAAEVFGAAFIGAGCFLVAVVLAGCTKLLEDASVRVFGSGTWWVAAVVGVLACIALVP